MTMKEYQGTYIVGDFASGQYSAASVWQPLSAIFCDDRSGIKNGYRGPYWLVFNFFQSSISASNANDENHFLLSSLKHTGANKDIPFMLFHVEQSSAFNTLCRKQAVAIATEVRSQLNFSERIEKLGDQFDTSPVWLDPRDFSSLLYFNSLSATTQIAVEPAHRYGSRMLNKSRL
jgi:hypothetical protein